MNSIRFSTRAGLRSNCHPQPRLHPAHGGTYPRECERPGSEMAGTRQASRLPMDRVGGPFLVIEFSICSRNSLLSSPMLGSITVAARKNSGTARMQDVLMHALNFALLVDVPFVQPHELGNEVSTLRTPSSRMRAEVRHLHVVDRDKKNAASASRFRASFEPRVHHAQPVGVKAAVRLGVGDEASPSSSTWPDRSR